MITLYKEEPRFHQPSLLLELLMDLEVALTKWRCEPCVWNSELKFTQ